jgi:hypothetical protein
LIDNKGSASAKARNEPTVEGGKRSTESSRQSAEGATEAAQGSPQEAQGSNQAAQGGRRRRSASRCRPRGAMEERFGDISQSKARIRCWATWGIGTSVPPEKLSRGALFRSRIGDCAVGGVAGRSEDKRRSERKSIPDTAAPGTPAPLRLLFNGADRNGPVLIDAWQARTLG